MEQLSNYTLVLGGVAHYCQEIPERLFLLTIHTFWCAVRLWCITTCIFSMGPVGKCISDIPNTQYFTDSPPIKREEERKSCCGMLIGSDMFPNFYVLLYEFYRLGDMLLCVNGNDTVLKI